MLPILALGAAGGAAVSFLGTLRLQNCVARHRYSQIPASATPYPNYYQRKSGKPYSNNTLLGFAACAVVFGATYGAGRIAINPLLQTLRHKYIYLPNTTIPKRIASFKGLLFDLAPELIVNSAPAIPAFPLAFYVKVVVDGPGRFENWEHNYNPYDAQVKAFDDWNLPKHEVKVSPSLVFPVEKAYAAHKKAAEAANQAH